MSGGGGLGDLCLLGVLRQQCGEVWLGGRQVEGTYAIDLGVGWSDGFDALFERARHFEQTPPGPDHGHVPTAEVLEAAVDDARHALDHCLLLPRDRTSAVQATRFLHCSVEPGL